MNDLFILKISEKTVNITSIGEEGVAWVPYPEKPEGYAPFLHLPRSGTYNMIVSNTQANLVQWDDKRGIPIRYIGYQIGTWSITVWCYLIREGMLKTN